MDKATRGERIWCKEPIIDDIWGACLNFTIRLSPTIELERATDSVADPNRQDIWTRPVDYSAAT